MGDESDKADRRRDAVSVMPAWSIWAGALILFAIGAVTLVVLFWNFGAATAQDEVRIRIVQLAGTVVLGAGGAVGLLLAARKQRSTELSLRQTERDLEIKTQAAEDARHDAAERRVTELFNAAAEQLGSDKAPVRMAALHTLERLGQDNPGHRHTVVKLLCAYLRMPFSHPDDYTASADDLDERRQELEVRRTAQRILTDHLKPGRKSGEVTSTRYWSGTSLDLTGAVLDGFDLYHGEVAVARFRDATFYGPAIFRETTFYGEPWFNETVFRDLADFRQAVFRVGARFRHVTFRAQTRFNGAVFHGLADLQFIIFHGSVAMAGVTHTSRMTLFGARRRWDARRNLDRWPTGWSLKPPVDDVEGQIDGTDGVWGFVVKDRQPAADAETQGGPPESSP